MSRFLTNKFGVGMKTKNTLEQLDARYVNTTKDTIEGSLKIEGDLSVTGKITASDGIHRPRTEIVNGVSRGQSLASILDPEDNTPHKYITSSDLNLELNSYFGFVPKDVIKRYFEYMYIRDSYKPTFWISYHFNNGLGFTNDKVLNDILGDRTIQGLSDLTHKFTNSKGYMYKNKYGLHFDENSSVTSQFKYSKQFTFFVLGKANGTLFTNENGTSILGWKDDKKNVLYIGENVGSEGIIDNKSISSYIEKPRDDNYEFYILTFDGKSKFIMNAIGNTFYNTTKGGNSWGKVVIGGETEGYIYECLCFNYALGPDNINKIKDFILSYYKDKI